MRLWSWHCDPTLSRDGASYLLEVQQWYGGASFANAFVHNGELVPSLYFYLIRLGMSCGLKAESAAIGISFVAGILAILLIYGIGRKVFRDERIALAAALLLALHPAAVELSHDALRGSLYLMLCLASGFCLLCSIPPTVSRISALGSGILLAAAVHCRYEAIELLPVFLVVLGWTIRKNKDRSGLIFQSGLWIVSFVATMLLLTLPSGLSWNVLGMYLNRIFG